MDCTFRDGGYYTNWDFSSELVNRYLKAVSAAGVDVAEIGFRFVKNDSFRGACAYTTDEFLDSLEIPTDISIGVLINASDLIANDALDLEAVSKIVPRDAASSKLNLVRIACHIDEIDTVLPATEIIASKGYAIGLNVMQISAGSDEAIVAIGKLVSKFPVDVLYFADSLGSMKPDDIGKTIALLREGWAGDIGLHAHDNQSLALLNSLEAIRHGATWIDSTVTGMGRGPGNVKTEELIIELDHRQKRGGDIIPLIRLVNEHFAGLKAQHGWGTNPFYYLAGKHEIHPSFIQDMLADVRYRERDILSVIDYLQEQNSRSYDPKEIDTAKNFYVGPPRGSWSPKKIFTDKTVLLIGTGPKVQMHRKAIESFVQRTHPIVLALNTNTEIDSTLIDLRVACNPIRLLADLAAHTELPQPLIAPKSMMPPTLREHLSGKNVFDFGIEVKDGFFGFYDKYCTVPNSMVIAYALAVVMSGKAKNIFLAGFDGYPPGDIRNDEINRIIQLFNQESSDVNFCSITPSDYDIQQISVYAL